MADPGAYALFLEKIHIFFGMGDGALFDVAENLVEKKFDAGEMLFDAATQANSLYIIFGGEVEEVSQQEGVPKRILTKGDFFGAEAKVEQIRNTVIKAKSDLVLLELPASSFDRLGGVMGHLTEKIAAGVDSRALLKKKSFDWLQEGENIYYAKQKHIILFWRRVLFPIMLIIAGIVLMWLWWISYLDTFWTFGMLAFVVAAVWLLWDWVDWSNDYYIITSNRIIWEEKVIGIYDSRQEANMAEVLSVSANTDVLLNSVFNYGTVSMTVMVGGMDLYFAPHPAYAKDLITELSSRAKGKAASASQKKLFEAVAKKLQPPAPPTKKKPKPPEPKKTRTELLQEKLKPKKKKKDTNKFKQRFEQDGTIIYRKHWIILVLRAFVPVLVTISLTAFFIYQLYLYSLGKPGAFSLSVISFLGLSIFIAAGWVWYQYEDWRNDIFKVTKDKIFDIDRKPFGDEQSRSASLDKIESLEYKRMGLWSIFFNVGTVYIHIGAEHFDFQNVLDPASVQRDINRRYMELHHKQKEAEMLEGQNQMIDWMVTYHKSAKLRAMMDDLEKKKAD